MLQDWGYTYLSIEQVEFSIKDDFEWSDLNDAAVTASSTTDNYPADYVKTSGLSLWQSGETNQGANEWLQFTFPQKVDRSTLAPRATSTPHAFLY